MSGLDETALHRLRATVAPLSRKQQDDDGEPPVSDDDARSRLAAAKLRKERALAARYERENRLKRGELVEVGVIRDAFALVSASIRRGIDGLRQGFGDRAAGLMEDALRAAEADVAKAFGGDG